MEGIKTDQSLPNFVSIIFMINPRKTISSVKLAVMHVRTKAVRIRFKSCIAFRLLRENDPGTNKKNTADTAQGRRKAQENQIGFGKINLILQSAVLILRNF